MFNLDKLGYKFIEDLGIWSSPNYNNISYSDGDYEEQRLAKIINSATDVSIFSCELRNQCVDWQTLYHLSSQRGNILRPFKDKLQGTVLEIGAGCGAITRFLGENGGNILALEGSQRRASIAASRTRDLSNTTVLAERFDDFHTDIKFDAITLIGVLEYASMFSSAEHAAMAMLEKIRGLLKPDGFLFIAIENQLGLKYFAGTPEDHVNKVMYGVEGRYKTGEPETYGKVAIEHLIKESGFAGVEILAPFPDYKLPSSIVTEAGCHSDNFDAAAFAWQSVASDPQLPRENYFSLINTWPVIFKNKLGMDLANSFLIAATPSELPVLSPDVLGYHYSTQRKKIYCKETIFKKNEDSIEVQYLKLADNQPADANEYVSAVPASAVYHDGMPLSFKFLELFTSTEWTIEQASSLFNKYLLLLKDILSKDGVDFDINGSVPGRYVDAIPQNIIIEKTGRVCLFDNEWIAPQPVAIGHLVFRSLILMLQQSAGLTQPSSLPLLSRRDFILAVMDECGIKCDETQLDSYNQKEVAFQTQVIGLDESFLSNWRPNELLVGGDPEYSSELRLYFRRENESFDQNQSFAYKTRSGVRNTYHFDIPASSSESTFLRLDPAEIPGWVLIHDVSVCDKQGNTLWSLMSDKPVLVDLELVQPYQDAVLYLSTSGDPQINIPVGFQSMDLSVSVEMETLDSQAVAKIAVEVNQVREQATSALQQEVQALRAKIDAQNVQLVNYANHMQTLDHTIAELRNSTSWKVTSPLRKLGGLNSKAKTANRLVSGLIQKHGVKAVASKGFYYIRKEGAAGVVARLKRQHSVSVPLPASVPTGVLNSANSSITYSSKDGYRLKPGHGGYCYVEPAKPVDLEDRIRAISSNPFFSIIIPVYNTPLDLLDKLLDSITGQWYPHWELILADDCSPDQELQAVLAGINHPQIRVIHAESNLRIAGATNFGIGAAQGDFIVFADHDDELTVDCLYELALCVERDQPDFIYSDEDKLTEDGNYTQPHFKPDWSPDTMMSTMFTCHASCVRRTLLEKTGLLRSEFDGCQDWDFVLRVAEQTDRISHIDKILYHWRIIPASVASDIAAKPYVLEASRQVRIDALKRRGLQGSVEPVTEVPGYFRVNYHVTGTPLISIIIPTRDNLDVLRRCVDSIISKTQYPHYEVIIVDNGSVKEETLNYFAVVAGNERVQVLRHDIPFNFSELNNVGVAQSQGEILLFLNDDTEVLQEDWLERMAGYAQLSHIGAVGAKLLYPGTRQIQHAGVLNLQCGPVHAFLRHDSDSPGYFMRNLLEYNWLAVTGACLMIERKKFLSIDGFDESFPVAYNDVDLCFKAAEHGLYNVVCQAVTLHHYESISRGLDQVDPVKQERLYAELARLYEKHPNYYQYDPFYNVNLAPNGINFDLPA